MGPGGFVTVGEALAEARYRAGLTVDEVSERTRIREAVIRCIEQDDYEACGGDLYVRGYVRAIAGAVGIDAQPLIRDYDAARAAVPEGARGARAAEPGTVAPHPAELPEPALSDDPAVTMFDLPVIPADPDATTADPAFNGADSWFDDADAGLTAIDPGFTTADPWFDGADPGFDGADPRFPAIDPGFTKAEWQYSVADQGFAASQDFSAARPVFTTADGAPTANGSPVVTPQPVLAAAPAPAYGRPREQSPWRTRIRGRRWVSGMVVLVAIALAAAGLAGSHIISSLRHTPAANSGNAASGTRQSAKPAPSKTAAPAKPTPSAAPRPVAPVRSLHVALAEAFGAAGTAAGDNPQSASFAITRGAPAPWQTDWYTTANFGLLKQGTGLLLDMGTTVTITSVHINLSAYQGADLQLRAGGTPVLDDLRVVTSASGVGGSVRLVLGSPVRARYLLIWFTLLPPNGNGKYQESISRVVVNGRP
jgi:hypothetical protein